MTPARYIGVGTLAGASLILVALAVALILSAMP